MTLDDALSEAIVGCKMRHDGMAEGVFVDYNFDGWRRQFPSGSSCGFSWTDEDRAANWYEYEPPKPEVAAWGDYTPPPAPAPKKRKAWVPPAEVNDIDDAAVDVAAWAAEAPTTPVAAQAGWAVFSGS